MLVRSAAEEHVEVMFIKIELSKTFITWLGVNVREKNPVKFMEDAITTFWKVGVLKKMAARVEGRN